MAFLKSLIKEPSQIYEVEVNLVEQPLKKTVSANKPKIETDTNDPSKVVEEKFSLIKLMPKKGYQKENTFESSRLQKKLSDEIVLEDLSFYKEIWKKIDSKFYYPDIFNTLHLRGGAFVKVYVNYDGSLSRYVLNVEGANEHIEFFIKALVVEALKGPIHSKLWKPKKEEVKLDLNFQLRMVTAPEATDGYSKGHVNRREMLFLRKVYNPKAHVLSKALPFLGGGGMIDVVYILNSLSGRQKRIYKRNLRKLSKFRVLNEKTYTRKHN